MSSWIERNILHHTGFLGRVSLDLTLSELPLATCNLFWRAEKSRVTAQEKFRLLGVTGGIPRYLEEMNPTLSSDANLQRMCFQPGGTAVQRIRQHLRRPVQPAKRYLPKDRRRPGRRSLDLERLYTALGVGKTGKIGDYAEDLIQTGLLARDYTWSLKTGVESKLSRLRLSDNYCGFTEVHPAQPQTHRARHAFALAQHRWILGLQFENIVLRNRHFVFQLLSIDPNDVIYDNPFFQRKTNVSADARSTTSSRLATERFTFVRSNSRRPRFQSALRKMSRKRSHGYSSQEG